MKSVIKHIVINLFEKKFRTFIVLLTVCLSTLVVFIGLSLNGIIKDTYASMLKGAYGDTNIIMSKSSDNPLYESMTSYYRTYQLKHEMTCYLLREKRPSKTKK